jgi:hypothetical protein
MDAAASGECAYELYVMTRAVADLALAADDPDRMGRLHQRVASRAGVPRLAVAIAIDDAVERRGDRAMEDLCSMCLARCDDRKVRSWR